MYTVAEGQNGSETKTTSLTAIMTILTTKDANFNASITETIHKIGN